MKKTLILLLTLACIAQAGISHKTVYSATLPEETEFTTAENQVIRLFSSDGGHWFVESAAGEDTANVAIFSGTVGSASYKVGDGEIQYLNRFDSLILASGATVEQEGSSAVNYNGANLFLHAGGVITADIYAGGTGNQYGETITFYNDKSTKLVLAGDITLVADSKFKVDADTSNDGNGAGSGPYIEGAINGADKTLTLTGSKTMSLSGGASLKTLTGSANVLLDAQKSDGTTDAASKIYEMVNATGEGTLTIDSGVELTLRGHATDATLQTTSKTISNNGTIYIGNSDTANTVILTKAQNYGAVHVRGNNTLKIDCTGEASGHFDLNGQGSIYSGKLIVGSNARLTARTNLWFNGNTNSGIDILDGGQLTRDKMVISTQQGQTATIRSSSGTSGTELKTDNGNVTLSNAVLTIEGATSETIVSLNLADSSLKNNSGAVVRENNAANISYVAVEAAAGNIVFAQKRGGLTVGDLTLADNKSVTTWSGTINQSAYSTITVTGALNAGTNSSVLNNLVLSDGVNLDFAGSVTLNGTLSLGTGITLSENMVLGDSYTLFTGVTGLTVAGASYTEVVDASTVFDITEGTYNLVFSEGSLKLETPVVPEPTTATLSLLALCGLAARRRRK